MSEQSNAPWSSGPVRFEMPQLGSWTLCRLIRSYFDNVGNGSGSRFDANCLFASVTEMSYFVYVRSKGTTCPIRKETFWTPTIVLPLLLILGLFGLPVAMIFVDEDTVAEVWAMASGATLVCYLISLVVVATSRRLSLSRGRCVCELPACLLDHLRSRKRRVVARRSEQASAWILPRLVISYVSGGLIHHISDGIIGEIAEKSADHFVDSRFDKDKEAVEKQIAGELDAESERFIRSLEDGDPIRRLRRELGTDALEAMIRKLPT